MPANRIAKKLARRYKEQGGKCYWCGRDTVLIGQVSTREIAKRFGIEIGSPNWRREARKREATAEHIIPKSAGGTDAWKNIVMACKGCNSARGNNTKWAPSDGVSVTRNENPLSKRL